MGQRSEQDPRAFVEKTGSLEGLWTLTGCAGNRSEVHHRGATLNGAMHRSRVKRIVTVVEVERHHRVTATFEKCLDRGTDTTSRPGQKHSH
jgi:hypothetical protein